jgi:hypothetical protein
MVATIMNWLRSIADKSGVVVIVTMIMMMTAATMHVLLLALLVVVARDVAHATSVHAEQN